MKAPIVPHLIIEKNNQILLLHRTNTRVCRGVWGTPTGGVEEGETLSKAIIREADEEIGISVKNVEHACTIFYEGVDFFDPSKSYRDICVFFKPIEYTGTPFNKEPAIHGDMQWFSFDHFPETILPVIKHALLCYKNNVPYSEFKSDFKGYDV